MKIELNYTYDELITLLDGLNNALISLKRNYSAMSFGLYSGVPEQLLNLKTDLKQEKLELEHRYNSVKELYDHLLTYETG